MLCPAELRGPSQEPRQPRGCADLWNRDWLGRQALGVRSVQVVVRLPEACCGGFADHRNRCDTHTHRRRYQMDDGHDTAEEADLCSRFAVTPRFLLRRKWLLFHLGALPHVSLQPPDLIWIKSKRASYPRLNLRPEPNPGLLETHPACRRIPCHGSSCGPEPLRFRILLLLDSQRSLARPFRDRIREGQSLRRAYRRTRLRCPIGNDAPARRNRTVSRR